MTLYPDTKIYIVCPAKVKTGGPELCHQFVSTLISFGVEAYVLYYPLSAVPFDKNDPVHDAYKKYHAPYVFELEDETRNIFVSPEGSTSSFYDYKKIRKVLWWMSVDNYLDNVANMVKYHLNNPLDYPVPKFFYFHKADDDIEHFVQSEYARQFIKLNGIRDEKIFMVEDYLNQAFLSRAAHVDLSRKENIVVFNPSKGYEITAKLMNFAPDIDWRPIKNMTAAQVQELLATAKVYIDFGNHPGKDRIPREAAISGCVVITGKRGSADNDIDINIPREFKFGAESNVGDVIKKIREVFENFPDAHAKQADYRARILDDKNRFVQEVATAFGINNVNRGGLALAQGFCDGTSLLVENLQRKSLAADFIIDDMMSTAEMAKLADGLILREQNRNYLRVNEKLVEIITRDDAKFLYQEGRINKFALLEPSDAELAELNNFYEPNAADVLNVERISSD